MAPTQVARRELLLAAKNSHYKIHALLHLTHQSRLNKSAIYYQAKRNHLRIDDRGDILIVHKHPETQHNVKIDVRTSAQDVADKIDTFLGELAWTSLPRTHAQHTQRPRRHTHHTHMQTRNTPPHLPHRHPTHQQSAN